MPNLSIKDVPEAWAEALRQRAAANHRSLQGELMALIEQAVVGPVQVAEPRRSADVSDREAPLRQGWKPIEQLMIDLRALRPTAPGARQSSSVRLVRAERDRR